MLFLFSPNLTVRSRNLSQRKHREGIYLVRELRSAYLNVI